MNGSLALNSSRSEELKEEIQSCLWAGASRKVGTAKACSSFEKHEHEAGGGLERLMDWLGLHIVLLCLSMIMIGKIMLELIFDCRDIVNCVRDANLVHTVSFILHHSMHNPRGHSVTCDS